MTDDLSPIERDVRADQTGIAAGGDVQQHAGRDAVGRDRITIDSVVVNARPMDRAAALEDEQHARLAWLVRHQYRDRLAQALDRVVRLELGLDANVGAVSHLLDRFVPRDRSVHPLPAGTSILEIFTASGGEQGGLLILGDPGAGKTTLLFELAVSLTPERHAPRPVPTYVPLSTWQQHKVPVAEWLAGQLNEMYFVPRGTARRWVETGRILPLLDGLDEIEDLDARAACVTAVNEFRRQYSLPLVVCSRREDYQLLPVQLMLEAAIVIRPLDPAAVLRHLRQAGPALAGVRAVLRDDPDLLEFCRSPLLLSMLTLTYYDQPPARLRVGESPEQRRERLFHDYVERRLELYAAGQGERTEGRRADAERRRALRWLSALALNLTRHDQKVFLLEHIAPSWLPIRPARAVVATAVGAIFGLIFGVIYATLFQLLYLLVFGSSSWFGWLDFMWSSGLTVAPLAGLVVAFRGADSSTERLTWRPTTDRKKCVSSLGIGLILGLTLGLGLSLMDGIVLIVNTRLGGDHFDLIFFSWQGFLRGGLLGAVVGALVNALVSKGSIAQHIRPNEGMARSLRNGVIVTGIGVLIGALPAVVVVVTSSGSDRFSEIFGLLSTGFAIGIFVAIFYGLAAVLQHAVLRFLLWSCRLAPLRYVKWLEGMVRARLLYRVGGGYEFVHGLLRNHFEKCVGPDRERGSGVCRFVGHKRQ